MGWGGVAGWWVGGGVGLLQSLCKSVRGLIEALPRPYQGLTKALLRLEPKSKAHTDGRKQQEPVMGAGTACSLGRNICAN